MKRISLFLIIVGVIISIVPIGGALYTRYKQKSLLDRWEDVANDYAELQSIFEDKSKVKESLKQNNREKAPNSVENSSVTGFLKDNEIRDSKAVDNKKSDLQKVLGILLIDKIGVKLPVVEGVKKEDLKIAAGHIPGTSELGGVGNAVVAAHRNYTFGSFFNRLDELQIGDKIEVSTKKGTYKYIVYKKLIVEPTDTSVLNRNNKDKVLTLITCHPMYIASHRLIIHARVME
ncbi:MAG: class D sortase [Clostridia bacterium]|nr:class D sortase [Clostridia bacterium]